MRAQRLEIIPIKGMPLVKELDDLSELILRPFELAHLLYKEGKMTRPSLGELLRMGLRFVSKFQLMEIERKRLSQ